MESSIWRERLQEGPAGVVATDREPFVCPALLPANPDWHPQPWAVTAWGGQMIDAAFGDTFLFNGEMRPEAVLGVGLQRRIWRAGPLALSWRRISSATSPRSNAVGSTTSAYPMPI